MRHTPRFSLLTFYKFIDIKNPRNEVAKHKQFCEDIGMMWRIYIWEEWISATMSCNEWQLAAYKWFLSKNPYFDDLEEQIEKKRDSVDEHQFDKMIVKYREEIVALWAKVTQDEIDKANKVLPIDTFKKLLDADDENWEILDMRNDYEWKLWHFKWAIPAWTVNFRETQELIDAYKDKFKWKKVLMYCTGWIRCEKLSTLLDQEWVDNFYWLEWWVVNYTNTFDDGNWLGNLYTFDGRVSCQVTSDEHHTPISECIYTGEKTVNCENCRYSPCNARIIATPQAYRKHFGFCSAACKDKAQKDLLIKNVDWDPIDYKSLRWVIKQDPTQKEAIVDKIAKYINKELLHTDFVHTTPQKEQPVRSYA